MSDQPNSRANRRQFLKLAGGGVAVLPLAALTGCSGEQPPAAPPAAPAPPPPAATPAPPSAAPSAPPAPPAQMARLALDDPQAKSLGYVHDAANVDQEKYARFEPGQNCANCALFQAKGDEEWAGCSIFPGKLVNAAGWCNVYAPKA